jgi:hypothetical protein
MATGTGRRKISELGADLFFSGWGSVALWQLKAKVIQCDCREQERGRERRLLFRLAKLKRKGELSAPSYRLQFVYYHWGDPSAVRF